MQSLIKKLLDSLLRRTSGLLLATDEVGQIVYYQQHVDRFSSEQIQRNFLASIIAVPLSYYMLSAYFLYPEYQENFVPKLLTIDSYLRNGIYTPAGKLKKWVQKFQIKCGCFLSILLKFVVGIGLLL